ncbi:unnamed protein product, partial [Mesorhabditis belari]|uniref:Uncharacterized protein n=1 Tax=Mesorhabditis belari TaxID=2138241 RepID=A0AAF3FPZ9_9BILA
MRNFNPKNYTMSRDKIKKRIDRLQKKGNWTQSGPEVFDHISNIIDNLAMPTDEDLEGESQRIAVTQKIAVTNKKTA